MDRRDMLDRPLRTLSRCLVCGSSEVRTDEVIDRGLVLLAECPRCDHRWTERPIAGVGHPTRTVVHLPAAGTATAA